MPYRLVTLLPGAHLWTMRRLAPDTHVPLLVHGQHVIQDSSGIIDYLDEAYPDRPLTPSEPALAAEAREWEALLDRELGQPLRRVFYHHALQDARFLASEYNRGGPFWGPWFYALALPTIRRAVAKMYAVNAENVAHDLERLRAMIERLDRHFSAHRYLVGERFSRADLSLAALGASLVHPVEHPARRYPSRFSLPSWLEQIEPFRGSATAERVRELYRNERHVIAA
jgi:glutathione S-transferase